MGVTDTTVRIKADNRTKDMFKRVNGDIKKTEASTKRLMSSTKKLAAAYAALRVAGAVFNTWRDFGKTISDLSAITGAMGEDLQFLTDKSLEFGASTTFTASEAAEAFKLVASAKPDLLESGAALAAVTKEALILAEASGSTLPDAARTLGVALNQYGAGADQASRFINVLAAGAQKGASEIADTAEAIKVAGLVAAGTGTSFEEMNAAIQVMSTVALKGSEAGTGLRNIYLNLANQANDKFKPALVGLTQAMINIREAGLNDVQMLEIFGKRNIVSAKALINNSDALVKMRDNLTGTSTAYQQASIKVDNLDGDMKRLGSVWESVALMLGKTFDPALRGIVQLLSWMAKAAKTVVLTFEDLGSKIGAAAAQLVSIAKLDFDAVTAIGNARDANSKRLEEEFNLIWDNTKAQEAQNKATEVNSKIANERLAKIKETAAAEAKTRADAVSKVNAELFIKEQQDLSDKNATALFALEESLMSQEERLRLSFDNRSFMVEDAFQSELINDTRRKELLLELQQKFELDKTKITEQEDTKRRRIGQRALGAAAAIFDGLGALMSKNGKEQSEATRTLARASIIASTAQAVMNALAVSPYPLGVALAAGAALKGAAQLQAVGGSGGGITNPGNTTNTSPISPPPNANAFGPDREQRGQTIVNIYGAITKDMIRNEVVPVLQNDLDNNDLILFSNTSRQASVNQ